MQPCVMVLDKGCPAAANTSLVVSRHRSPTARRSCAAQPTAQEGCC